MHCSMSGLLQRPIQKQKRAAMAKVLVRGVEKWIGKFHGIVEGPGEVVVIGWVYRS